MAEKGLAPPSAENTEITKAHATTNEKPHRPTKARPRQLALMPNTEEHVHRKWDHNYSIAFFPPSSSIHPGPCQTMAEKGRASPSAKKTEPAEAHATTKEKPHTLTRVWPLH